MRPSNLCVVAFVLSLAAGRTAWSQAPLPDLSVQPTLFVVGYAHLDTEWRWMYPQTIREFIPATLDVNFAFFDKYPGYVFNFSGSRRYQMMREYYPEKYAELKTHVAAGRWFPCGSSVDENDANVPSAESLVRHVLYGNRYFARELGVTSEEYMLPDCFGFPAALPSVLAHCGIRGFSTQKLTWNAAVPIPFKVGVWEGPDGRSVIAALDPGSYGGEVLENLASSEGWKKRVDANGVLSGVFADYHYYGTGDQGGGPTDRSVAMVEQSIGTQGPLKIIAGPADWLFEAITPAQRERLPRYKGELQLTEHSAGSITSEAYMKRWNRKNELLADAAERAAVAAAWLGASAYPAQKLEDAWTLVLGSQMHDILPGTSHPTAYDYAWNDEVLAGNELGAVLQEAVSAVAGALDTRAAGVALVVFNPLSVAREDVVEAEMPGDASTAKGVEVIGPDGQPVAAQILGGDARSVRLAFLAKLPPVGFAVYDARLMPNATRAESSLRVEEKRLENDRYVVKIDDSGDVASVFDKRAQRELLAGPARLSLHYENPKNWPAWNQDWADRQQPVRELVAGPASVRVVERGPARVAVEVTRALGSSTFVQVIRLGAGDAGARVEFDTRIDWAARERSLRATFPLTVANPLASYDLQVGVLERPNAHEKQFEYASHQWFDLTDSKGDYGVTVMNDSKYGSDKPDDHTLRLTLLHTPGTRGGYQDQGTQDLGRHHVLYALAGHAGDWRAAKSAVQAERLNQPARVFRAAAHEGPLGKSFSLLKTSDDNLRVTALKKAEETDEIIVRLRELSGREIKGAKVSAARPIVSAREVDGQEREIGPADVRAGELTVDIRGFELRAFALKLGEAPVKRSQSQSTPLALAFDTDAVSTNAKRDDGAIDGKGRSLPAEQLPRAVVAEEASFQLGPTSDGAKNAVTCRGQEIELPAGGFDRLYLLAASSAGDVRAEVQVDGTPRTISVPDWSGFIGQWDRRVWLGNVPEQAFDWSNELGGIEPGFVKPDPVAWYSSHHHTPSGDAYYQYCYLWKCAIDLKPGAKTIRLPNDERVKVFAASAVRSGPDRLALAAPLFDTLDDRAQDAPRLVVAGGAQSAPNGPNGSGVFEDAVDLAVEPRLYWRPGAIRYTLDGSEPNASSPAYAAPFVLNRTSTVKAGVLDGEGRLGPISTLKIEVDDKTPPTVKRVLPAFQSPLVHVEFSEPIEDSAAMSQSYTLEPAIAVRSVRRGSSPREVILELASAPEIERAYQLKIAGVKDTSPAHNAIRPAAHELKVKGPVFKLERVAQEEMGTEIRDVAGLPVEAADPWTINMLVRIDAQPANRTLIAGFGKCEQTSNGVARYAAKFANGLRFWSHNCDVDGRVQLEIGPWQMVTTTYDGRVVRLYKDGQKIGEREVQLSDDENAVHIAPIDPWEKKRRFAGEIRDFTIWDAALSEEAIQSLKSAAALR